MNQKQFQAGRQICEFGKIFADQMLKCLRDSGLKDLGYGVVVDVGRPIAFDDGKVLVAAVRLTKVDDSYTKDFSYHKYLVKGWEKMYEPTVLPDDVRKVQEDHGVQGSGTEKEVPFAPDGLWLSNCDDPDYVDGGWIMT